jgi:hypothetical protein
MIARGLGLPNEEVARIRAAAAVHDVGKLRTPKAILNKPGRLTDEEFEVIKRHPVDGAAMVAALGDPELTRIVRHHHERLDGAGYPDRLQGEEIPLGARIIAVADTFDAITSARPYRDAAPHQKAIDILRKEAGAQLDPDAVRSFLAYYSGSRPTVVWAIITSSLRRVVSWLSGDPAAAATISASKVAAATAATAAIGAVAGAAPVPVVHHAPIRPVVSHASHVVPAHPRGVAIGLRGRTVSVPAPATPSAKATSAAKAKRAPGKAHGRKTRHAPAGRSHPASQRAHSRAAQGGTGAQTHASAANRNRASAVTHSTPAVVPTSSHASSSGQVDRSQGSNANGNAYGHTKPLGNGHGQGEAKGHGGSGSSSAPPPSSSRRPSTPAPVSTPAHTNSSASGPPNANAGSGSGDSGSGGKGQSDGQTSHSAVSSPSDSGGGSQGGQAAPAAQTDGGHQGSGSGSGS